MLNFLRTSQTHKYSEPGQILRKSDWRLLPAHHGWVSYGASHESKEDHVIVQGVGSRFVIHTDRPVTEMRAIFLRHAYSGKVLIRNNGGLIDSHNLYSPFGDKQIVTLFSVAKPQIAKVSIEIIAAGPEARANQAVLCGLLIPDGERLDDSYETTSGKSDVNSEKEFEHLQKKMVDGWVAAILARGETVEEVMARRFRAYQIRFREYLAYSQPGDRMLDIGTGHVSMNILEDVASGGVELWSVDIDDRVVEANKQKFDAMGWDPKRVAQSKNSVLNFPDQSFDIVSSSHCLEHSDDLKQTFGEIHRVLKPSGFLFFAVPFGWDDAREHIYALSIDDWRNLAESNGLSVVNVHIGSVYPEQGHDVLIACRKR